MTGAAGFVGTALVTALLGVVHECVSKCSLYVLYVLACVYAIIIFSFRALTHTSTLTRVARGVYCARR